MRSLIATIYIIHINRINGKLLTWLQTSFIKYLREINQRFWHGTLQVYLLTTQNFDLIIL